MSRHSSRITGKVSAGLRALLEALDYAEDVQSDVWEFAVSIRRLQQLGCTETDLRWLVRKGYVQHAREVTAPGDNGRYFRPTGDLTFSKRTCFVLSPAGAAKARESFGQPSNSAPAASPVTQEKGEPASLGLPDWDPEARILQVDGKVVKWFKWRAANQEAVLCAFQEEGWPRRIDDPLPPEPEQDSKRRLADTIKCLNNKQKKQLLRFHGDGTGEGVTWERIETNGKLESAD